MAPTVLLKQYTATTNTKVLQSSNNKVSKGTNSISLGMMAKTRKFPKSHHSTSASSAPRRKSTTDNNLNIDRNINLGISTRVYSISNLSVSERKELQINLQRELEELRIVERKYLSSNYSNGGVHSSSHNVPNIKRSVSARVETGRHGASSIPASSENSSLMKQCEDLLKYLMNHKNGFAFREPVDPIKLGIPDYFSIIQNPMDLGTIMKKLKSGAYCSPWGFASDVRLTFVNATAYNPPGNHVHVVANSMSKLFESKFKAIEKKMKTEVSMEREETFQPTQQIKRRKLLSKNPPPSPPLSLVVPSPKEKVEIKNESLTEDRLHVHRLLRLLEEDLPEHIQDFLRRQSIAGNQQLCGDEIEIEIDIDSFNHDVILQLKKLLNEHMDYLKSSTNQKKEDHFTIEIPNGSGVSNSSILPPCKVNEPDEEDVDIGGNDPPMITYPPIEIEKEKDVRNGRFSSGSSSSSSGGSSSSSSDSDSASSSDSESENANDLPTACPDMENIQHVASPNHVNSEFLNPNDVKNQFELKIQSEATLLSDDVGQQVVLGENGLSDRQVSPEKLIRAALLKNRFADTILKFREPFDKVENGDPEKLRSEKEEYEKQKKRDKARIQAEAKAAEEACRQSEAAMAAEAKKKREAEREAARQAVLRVEKTVEINGCSEFLNDLDILRTASAPGDEHRLTAGSINDTSLEHSPDCIGGGFMLGGNNPLEQLGLYIKEYDEDEEENENVDVAIGVRADPSNNSHSRHIMNNNNNGIDRNGENNNSSSSNNSSNGAGGEVDG